MQSPGVGLTSGARDMANAPAIKAAIASRSAERGDSADIQKWLASHFFRYVVGHLQADAPAMVRIDTLATAQQKLGGSIPDWIDRRLKDSGKHGSPDAPIWWIDPDSRAVQEVEHRLVEFLSTRADTPLEGKLMRVNALQALAQWAAEHQAMEARQLSGWRTHQPEAVQVVWQGADGEFVEMLPKSPQLREELAFESQCMRHCVGQFGNRRKLTGGYGEHYAASCEQGRMRLFSYRTGQSQPRITLSAVVKEDGQLEIEQIKGKQNRPPVDKYHADVLAFLQSLPTTEDTPNDALTIGLVRLPSGWMRAADIASEPDQLALFARHPEKLALVAAPSPLVQWLALAHTPQQVNAPVGSDLAAVQALAGIERLGTAAQGI
ncbi:MAG: hypothetical protein ACTS5V_11990 [Giesbergeria sp.]